jgi:hypothetical protein
MAAPTIPNYIGPAQTPGGPLTGPLGAGTSAALGGANQALGGFSTANNPTYGGPQTAGNLAFNPAGVAQNLYQSQLGLLEPGMQSQFNALDQNLKAQGYDTNQAGGAQTAENNLMNQQNLVRAQTANWAAGQAIPQGAQQLAAQESIPLTQQQVAQGAFGAGLQSAQLPISEAQGLTNIGLGGIGVGQQQYANQVGQYNTGLANQANTMNGLLGLGQAGLGAYATNPQAINGLFGGLGSAIGTGANWLGNQVGSAGNWASGLLGLGGGNSALDQLTS